MSQMSCRLAATASAAIAALSTGCPDKNHGGVRDDAPPEARGEKGTDVPAAPTEPIPAAIAEPREIPEGPVAREREPSETPHPRIVLTDELIADLRRRAKAETPAWKLVEARCDVYMEDESGSGFMGLMWAEAFANLAICWHATGERRYHDWAFVYLDALLDDGRDVGDGKGGESAATRDKGYPIRTHGAWSALAYDWMYDAPGMTLERRAKIIDRLEHWLAWYDEEGYFRDNVFGNYFWGYMAALTYGGLALDGHSDAADGWLAHSRELLESKVIPGFAETLRGGEWAEGWQYGPLVVLEASFVLRGYQTATGADYFPRLPWLEEIVSDRLHAMRPDRGSMYDNGTHIRKPPPPNPHTLMPLALVLEDTAPQAAAEARFLLRNLYPEAEPKGAWLAFVTEDSDAGARDPRKGEPLSYHAPGPGITFARSGWDRSATWVSFQAGPRVTPDHQHADQGHFELFRGGDGLFVDGGNELAWATINHNTLLIDDGGKALSYEPNQGVWPKQSSTTHFADDGHAVVARGEITDAWDPGCVRSGCDKRAVSSVVRTLVYVRPSLLVIDDRVALTDPGSEVRWAAHALAPPEVSGQRATVTRGASRAWLETLVPKDATLRVHKEPTTDTHKIHRANRPYTDMWRMEAEGGKGGERRFLHWIVTGPVDGEAPDARAVRGDGLRGAIGGAAAGGGDRVAVLFAEAPSGGRIELPEGVDTVLVEGLEPGAAYALEAIQGQVAAGSCQIEIAREDGGDLTANRGGFVRAPAAPCPVR